VALCHPKLFYKILFGQSYLLVYNRFYKNKTLLEKPSTEGAIKKIVFSSSISPYSYLKTLGWEPGFDRMFSETNPSRWERSARKCFIKPMLLGANGEVYENPKCWEHSVSLRKPELLGAVGGGDVFENKVQP
jgi:hypothetical protein